jgi:zinc transporter ZupT
MSTAVLHLFIIAITLIAYTGAHEGGFHHHSDHPPQQDGACPHYKIPLPHVVTTAAATSGELAHGIGGAAHQQCECDAPVKCAADADGPSTRNSPLEAVGGSFVTAIVPACTLVFFPQIIGRSVLNLMLAFAAGALVCDVLTHSIPQMSGADHHHDEAGSHADHTLSRSSALLLVGIVLFYVLEGVVERLSQHRHDHGHGQSAKAAAAPDDTSKGSRKRRTDGGASAAAEATLSASTPRSHEEKHETTETLSSDTAHNSNNAAFLSLVADFSHNVMDGIAIGTAFASSSARGQRVVAVILAHEIPHELADFAVLKMCGWQRRSIVASQLVTAVGNLAGAMIAFYLSSWSQSVEMTLVPVVAGSFLYLALCVILPQLGRSVSCPWARAAHGVAFMVGAVALNRLS